jgi:predicted transcriptional regulator
MAKTEPSVLDDVDPKTEERALQEAEKDIEKGRVISHAAIKKWLRSWGKANELPPPKCGQ